LMKYRYRYTCKRANPMTYATSQAQVSIPYGTASHYLGIWDQSDTGTRETHLTACPQQVVWRANPATAVARR
jgi:hypothetical protein